MQRIIITFFLLGAVAFNAGATWVSQRQCDYLNNTFGAASIQNGNCVQADNPKDGYLAYSCTEYNFVTLICQDAACQNCKQRENHPLNQCTDSYSERNGRYFYQCFPDDQIDFEKVIDSQSYLLQSFSYGDSITKPCDAKPTQIFVSPVDTCFSQRRDRGSYITCNGSEVEFRQYDNISCANTPVRTYRNALDKCYSVEDKLGEVLSCVLRK